ncbi:hypothetical protein V6N13_059076 [Hibiscus sabdariffa]
MSSTPLIAAHTAVDPPDPPDLDRLSDRPDPPVPEHVPLLPSDDSSSAMDISGPAATDLSHPAATSPLAPAVVTPIPFSTPSYKDKLLASGSSGSQPTSADFVDEEDVLLLDGDVSRSNLLINGRLQVVEYESLPTVCFECGKYGHVKDICPSTIRAANSPPPTAPLAPTAPSVSEAFGPWMLVEHRQRRSSRKAPSHNDVSPVSLPAPAIAHGSRFNPIFEEGLDMALASADTNGLRQRDVVLATNSDATLPTTDTNLDATLPTTHSNSVVAQSVTVDIPAVGQSTANTMPDLVIAPPTSKSFVSQVHGRGNSKFSANKGDSSKHLALSKPLRKPITVQRSATASTSKTTTLTTRRSSSLSSTRFAPFPRPSTRFNKANHTAVVVDENADPNVLSPTPAHSPAPVLAQTDSFNPCEMVTMSKDGGVFLPAGISRDNVLQPFCAETQGSVAASPLSCLFHS